MTKHLVIFLLALILCAHCSEFLPQKEGKKDSFKEERFEKVKSVPEQTPLKLSPSQAKTLLKAKKTKSDELRKVNEVLEGQSSPKVQRFFGTDDFNKLDIHIEPENEIDVWFLEPHVQGVIKWYEEYRNAYSMLKRNGFGYSEEETIARATEIAYSKVPDYADYVANQRK